MNNSPKNFILTSLAAATFGAEISPAAAETLLVDTSDHQEIVELRSVTDLTSTRAATLMDSTKEYLMDGQYNPETEELITIKNNPEDVTAGPFVIRNPGDPLTINGTFYPVGSDVYKLNVGTTTGHLYFMDEPSGEAYTCLGSDPSSCTTNPTDLSDSLAYAIDEETHGTKIAVSDHEWQIFDTDDSPIGDAGEIDYATDLTICPSGGYAFIADGGNGQLRIIDMDPTVAAEIGAETLSIVPDVLKCVTSLSTGEIKLITGGLNVTGAWDDSLLIFNVTDGGTLTLERTISLGDDLGSYSSIAVDSESAATTIYTTLETNRNLGVINLETGAMETTARNSLSINPQSLFVIPPPLTDADSDGYDSLADGGTDCDDTNASINPGATETYYDGVDQDCSSGSDYDQDGDTYDSTTYGGSDCDDANASIHPGATETWYDGIDQDCSGTSDWDADGDGYDSAIYRGEAMYLISTVKAGGTVESDTYDCNDLNAGVNPDAEEICTDGIDNNCDTLTDSEDIGACPTDTGDDTGDTGDSDADTDADADTDTDTDADSDTDTDADSDADTDSDSDADTDTGGESCTPEVLDGETAPLNCDIICFDEPECDVFIYGVKEGPYTYTLDDGSVTLIPTGDGSLGMGLSDQLDADNLETAKPIGEIFDLGGAEAAAIFFSDAKTSIEKGIFTLEMVDTSKFGIYKNISLGSPDTPINSNNFGDFFKVEKGATIITEDGRPQEGTTAKEILNVCQENPNACAEELTKPTEEPKVCGCSSTPKESPNDLWGLGGLGLTLGLATMRRRKKIIELGENPYPSSPDSADKS